MAGQHVSWGRLKGVAPAYPLPQRRGAARSGLLYLAFVSIIPGNWCQGGPLMEEKRKYPRTEISEPAYVSSGGSVMSCMVRNISAEGAAIDIENPGFVPARFRLVMANDSSVYECKIAWIRQNRIGLTFVAMPKGASSE
jgi:hypothetical protein